MKALVLHGPGDVRFEEVPEPAPGPGELIVRTLAAMTCGTDLKVVRRGYHARMLTPPCLFGHEAAGEVSAVGEGVTAFNTGDLVVAANSAPCGVCRACGRGRESLCEDLVFWNGTFAEAYRVPARVVAKNVLRLEGVAPEDAAMTEPLACCVKGVEETGVRPDDRVLVIGAGSIGLMLTRLCDLIGAHVTATARRPEALVAAAGQGARETRVLTSGEDGLSLGDGPLAEFDVVFDAGGAEETAALAIRSAARGGTVNLFAGCPAGTTVGVDVTRVHYDEIQVLGSFHHTPSAIRQALRLIGTGAVQPARFVTATPSLAQLPESLVTPARDTLKNLVRFPSGSLVTTLTTPV